jgi:hypothetical protein
MAIFKYQKYLAINIDFVNILKTFLLQKKFSTVIDMVVLHVINLAIFFDLKTFLFKKFFSRN